MAQTTGCRDDPTLSTGIGSCYAPEDYLHGLAARNRYHQWKSPAISSPPLPRSTSPGDGVQPHGGPLLIVGGRFEQNNFAVLNELKRLSAGTRLGVLATASEHAEEVAAQVTADYCAFGIDACVVPLSWQQRTQSAFAPAVVAAIKQLGSVYFTGGDQQRIMETLWQNDGSTPALDAIRALHVRGGLVAGSSAGAAVMSDPMIAGGASLEALTQGVVVSRDHPGIALAAGLGFFGWGLIDQHFIQRGRIGRLVVALQGSGRRYGFGIDENTALVVEGDRARVVGETGVVVVDASRARFGANLDDIDDVWISYLDDGDAFDLRNHKVLPHPSKRPLRISKHSFRAPARVARNAFGAYALHDLMMRLVQGDPHSYHTQLVTAIDRQSGVNIEVELNRVPRRSRALMARRDGERRFSAIDFRLQINKRTKPAAGSLQSRVSPSDSVSESHLLLLGGSPVEWVNNASLDWLRQLVEPVGIIAAAAERAGQVAAEYAYWLHARGVRSQVLDLTTDNAERRNADPRFLRQLQQMGSLIFPGGDQRRLVRTLRRRGEQTPAFRIIQQAFAGGLTLVGIGGAAAAFGTRMIAEGTSREALLYGSSSDAGHRGLVIEEGLGFFRTGLIDQNFVRRHRLGRLIVGCAEEGFELGLGLGENAGVAISGSQRELRMFGTEGTFVVSIDQQKLELGRRSFAAEDVALHHVQPGQGFDLNSNQVQRDERCKAAAGKPESVQGLVDDLLLACGNEEVALATDGVDSWLRLALSGDQPARLSVHSSRDLV